MIIKEQGDNFFGETEQRSPEREKLLEMIDSHSKKFPSTFSRGDLVSGKITKIGEEYIFVDIGARNDAIISKNEVIEKDGILKLNVGDIIKAYIVSANQDEIILGKSMSYGKEKGKIDDLYEAYKNRVPVNGKVTGVSKDGLNVKILGYRAFCPISQVDIKFTDNVNVYLGKTLDFVITKLSDGGRNIVVSRIPLLEEELSKKLTELEESITERKIFKGKITKITDFGLFVDLGFIEGLVHKSEVSWEKIENLADIYSVGQEVECIVVKVERKKPLKESRVSLSIKQLTEDPWKTIDNRLSCGQSVRGKVVKIINNGAFVEILPGIDGFIPISEMSWVKRVHHPSEVVNIGDEVSVTVLNIDTSKRSITLTLKDIANDPWNNIETRFPVGTEAIGIVAKKSKFGYFVDLAEGITGLLVFSRIDPEKKDSIKEGEQISVFIESIDKENRRISLSYGIRKKEEVLSVEEANMKATSQSKSSSTEFGTILLEALKKVNKI
ncbi:MAG: S1 RNA-binding domain-containing protein [Chitinispirillaceae bacterium]|nr:S1 RNA-binding domain-containing protein [Chitinispirillaceae bacterium]